MSSNNTPNKNLQTSPAKFVKPADLFKMRRRTSSNFGTPNNSNSKTCSPTKATNSTRSSPVKSFSSNSCSNHQQNQLTPNKNNNIRKLMNFSPGPFQIESQSPLKCLNNFTDPSPTKNLPVLLKNPFNQPVKRRLNLFSPRKNNSTSATSRLPNKRTRLLEIDEDANLEPPKMKRSSLQVDKRIGNNSVTQETCYKYDWTLKTKMKISIENNNNIKVSVDAIKEISNFYQHPYLSWLPLFPRVSSYNDNPFKISKDSLPAQKMHQDWCESLKDLTDSLLNGRCLYFYVCSDMNNILFKRDEAKSSVEACIAPFYYNMGLEFNKKGIKFSYPEMNRNHSFSCLDQESSQTSFSSSSKATASLNFDNENSSQATKNSKLASSGDSGNYSDLNDDEFGIEENDENDEDASQCLESIGIPANVLQFTTRQKGFLDANSNTQTKTTSTKPLAIVEGCESVQKLVDLLQNSRTYTINDIGRFASIPPTLLSPVQFRSSTLQTTNITMTKNETSSSIELNGVILPNLFKKLHHLLPSEHSCTSALLDSSKSFKDLPPFDE